MSGHLQHVLFKNGKCRSDGLTVDFEWHSVSNVNSNTLGFGINCDDWQTNYHKQNKRQNYIKFKKN